MQKMDSLICKRFNSRVRQTNFRDKMFYLISNLFFVCVIMCVFSFRFWLLWSWQPCIRAFSRLSMSHFSLAHMFSACSQCRWLYFGGYLWAWYAIIRALRITFCPLSSNLHHPQPDHLKGTPLSLKAAVLLLWMMCTIWMIKKSALPLHDWKNKKKRPQLKKLKKWINTGRKTSNGVLGGGGGGRK